MDLNWLEPFAWPIVGGVVAIVGIFAFRKPLVRLLDRTEKVTREGLETGPAQQQLGTVEEKTQTPWSELNQSPVLIAQMEVVKKGLEENVAADEREKTLIAALAEQQLIGGFLELYSIIFGSQLNLLQALNARGDSGAGADEVRQFYETASEVDRDFFSEFPRERWLGFLIGQNVIEEAEDTVRITVLGREFLAFLVRVGKSLHKDY